MDGNAQPSDLGDATSVELFHDSAGRSGAAPFQVKHQGKTGGRGHSQCERVRRRRSYALQLPHELNQIVLFLGSEFEFQDQVEELHRVF